MTHIPDNQSLLALILASAFVTYMLRVVPLTMLRKPFKNPFLVALLDYMPYALLSSMIFPTMFYATDSSLIFPSMPPIPAVVGTITALIFGYFKKSLPVVAFSATSAAYITFLLGF